MKKREELREIVKYEYESEWSVQHEESVDYQRGYDDALKFVLSVMDFIYRKNT